MANLSWKLGFPMVWASVVSVFTPIKLFCGKANGQEENGQRPRGYFPGSDLRWALVSTETSPIHLTFPGLLLCARHFAMSLGHRDEKDLVAALKEPRA